MEGGADSANVGKADAASVGCYDDLPELLPASASTDDFGAMGDQPLYLPGASPTDADIIQQQNDLRAEQTNIPLLGDLEPLTALEAEYLEGSQVFLRKIHRLKELYSSIRRTRGDGNCFYR